MQNDILNKTRRFVNNNYSQKFTITQLVLSSKELSSCLKIAKSQIKEKEFLTRNEVFGNKKCPLMNGKDCLQEECAFWSFYMCSIVRIAKAIEELKRGLIEEIQKLIKVLK